MRLKSKIAAIVLCLALFECAQEKSKSIILATQDESAQAKLAPDNTGRNQRDIVGGPKTPENQSENERDLKLTQEIRQALVGDGTLSINAKNIKIISADGKVTLRGPVENLQEKNAIQSKAQQIAGFGNVDNLLEIKTE